MSKDINFEVLRGLTNALLAAKKPDEVLFHVSGLLHRFIELASQRVFHGKFLEEFRLVFDAN